MVCNKRTYPLCGLAITPCQLLMKLFPEAVELADPVQYNTLAMLDLNGNGKLEIVLEGLYYEGRFVTVYESSGADIQSVLAAGCRL